MPDSTLLVASSLGELQRDLGKKARAARGHSMGLTECCWTGQKSSSGFSCEQRMENPNELLGPAQCLSAPMEKFCVINCKR